MSISYTQQVKLGLVDKVCNLKQLNEKGALHKGS